jgi:hypothetical protein
MFIFDLHSYNYNICISIVIPWQHIDATAATRRQLTSTTHRHESVSPPRMSLPRPRTAFTTHDRAHPHTAYWNCNLPKGLVMSGG